MTATIPTVPPSAPADSSTATTGTGTHETHRHAAPKPGPWTRYRNTYEKLPPAVQLIGLQVWLPIFFSIAFCFCYVLAFHSPTPKDVPVAIIGSSSQVGGFASQLESSAKGELAVSTTTDEATARAQVKDGDLAAAYIPGSPNATLVIGSANQYQLATLAKTVFTQVATQSNATLVVDDEAPLPAHDSFGTSLFYVTLAVTIGGYMVAMFVGMMGAALRHRVRFAILAGSSIFLPFIITLITHNIIGAVSGNFFQIWGIAAATSFAIGMVVNGLAYFLGRFVTGAALLIFVFMTVPASGGAYPPEFLPAFFRFVHPFVSGTATIDLLRNAAYGVGTDPWRGYLLLGCYAAAGILLALVGRPLFVRRARKAAIMGKRPSMMAHAQAAAMAAGRKAAEEAANSVAAGGGSGSAPSDGDPDDRTPHVDTDVVRVHASHAGQLHRDHRSPVSTGASGGPSAGAVAAGE